MILFFDVMKFNGVKVFAMMRNLTTIETTVESWFLIHLKRKLKYNGVTIGINIRLSLLSFGFTAVVTDIVDSSAGSITTDGVIVDVLVSSAACAALLDVLLDSTANFTTLFGSVSRISFLTLPSGTSRASGCTGLAFAFS